MRVLVVLGHPSETSLNHAIAEVAMGTLEANGHNVVFHDLYAEKFNPLLPAAEEFAPYSEDIQTQRYIDDLSAADGIVIVHPNWWGMPPAIVKGWLDRSFRPGCAYTLEVEGGVSMPVGLLKASQVVIFNTENTPEEIEREYYGDPLDKLWRNIFNLCGARDFYRRMFHGVMISTEEQRHAWLVEVQETMDRYFPTTAEKVA